MGTYVNTSLYQPSIGYNQGFQSDFGTSMTSSLMSSPSIFQSQYNCAPMAPQQSGVSSSDDMMGLMMGLLLTLLIQGLNQGPSDTVEETEIDDTEDIPEAAPAPAAVAAAPAAGGGGGGDIAGAILDPGGIFDGW